MRALPLLCIAATIGCRSRGAPDPDPDDTHPVGHTGTSPAAPAAIRGSVVWGDAETEGVVAGAVVSLVGGPTVEADERGVFAFADVPPGPIVLHVEGPRAADADHPWVHSSRDVALIAAPDGSHAVDVELARGCEGTVDAGAGGALRFDACGGAGLVAVDFPPAALVDAADRAFAGTALVELAAMQPGGRPGPFTEGAADAEAWPQIVGAAEVRLSDALTGAPLQVAGGSTVDVSFEIAAGVDAAEITLEWFDPASGTWQTIDEGGTGEVAGVPVYTWSASHFTRLRGVSEPVELTFLDTQAHFGAGISCVSGCPTGWDCCGNTCCEPRTGRTVNVRVQWPGGTRIVSDASPRCVPVPADTQVSMLLRSLQPEGGRTRLYASRPRSGLASTPPPSDDCNPSNPGVTVDVGPIELVAEELACVTGNFHTRGCMWVTDPQTPRPIEIMLEDDTLPGGSRHLGTVYDVACGDPADPADDICLDLPVGVAVRLINGAGGGSVVVEPVSQGADLTCPQSAPFTDCQTMSSAPAAGVTVVAARLGARVLGESGGRYTVELDASDSDNAITYTYSVKELPSGNRVFHDVGVSDAVITVELPPGSYAASLRAYGASSRSDRAARSFDLPAVGDPVAVFTVTPSPIAGEGELVTLDGTASFDDGAIVEYAWDFDDDTIVDATGPTTSHAYASEGLEVIALTVTDDDGNAHTWRAPLEVVDASPTLTVSVTGDCQVVSEPFVIDCDGTYGGVCEADFPKGQVVFLVAYDGATECFDSWPLGCDSGLTDGRVCGVELQTDWSVELLCTAAACTP